MKNRLKQAVQTLLICLIVPSTLLLQEKLPYLDLKIPNHIIFQQIFFITLLVATIWVLKELWFFFHKK